MAEKNEVFDLYDFPVHDWTQAQSGSPYNVLFFIIWQIMQITISVKKDC